ncbi:MAG: hypothetical protein ACKO23_11985 [Gemmataceae bacterium]
MNWESLIIPMIAFAVWIISSVFRGMEEAKDKASPVPPVEDRPMKVPQKRPMSSDLERFLQEARVIRDPNAPPLVRLEDSPEKPKKRKADPVPARPKPPPKPRDVPDPEPLRRASEIPRSAPSSASASPAPVPTAKAASSPSPAPSAPAPPANATVAATISRKELSPVLVRVREMLNNRQSLVAAIILEEVLGSPLSKRRHR